LFTTSERFFLQGALINTKLRNRLNKSTFEKIICLKSWGIFINEEEEIKKAEKEQELKEKKDFGPENQFFLPEKA
jgi:hypothetical protein